MSKDKIIILGAFRFPDKDAAAKRVYGFGKYLRTFNYDIDYISWCNKDEEHIVSAMYDDFNYVSLSEFNNGEGTVFTRILRYLTMGTKTLKYLKEVDISNVKRIIAYHGTSIFLLKLRSFCRKHNIELILDVTEWYDYSDLSGGKLGLVSLDNAIRMNFINPLIGNIIVISSFLYEFYKDKANNVILIPFLIDIKNSSVGYTIPIENKIVRLVYIGSPGKKDKFDIILKVLSNINRNNSKITLDVYGLNLNEYKKINLKIDEQLLSNSYITFKGRIPHHLVASIYDKYHFSILFRPNKRYARAGFPTKLVESLSYGVPIIASNVGDVSKYVINNKSGFLLESLEENKLNIILNDILHLTDYTYGQMKKESIQVAIEKFDLKKEKRLIDFIKGED